MTEPRKPEMKGQNVGIGEYYTGDFVMTSIGLGSCVALILHDRKWKKGAVAHVMLPESNGKMERPGKFADTAVTVLYEELISGGSNKRDIVAKIAGGSSMFKHFKGNLDIGSRNVAAIKSALEKYHIPLVEEDTGGTVGRSIIYYPEDNGKVIIRKADGKCIEF
ncbi:chemotaxis protein CheD [Methanoplanus limicola]|uniref:Probable chemoreceptor glutamine deamidase CheD n=1 Tax=Methanoplanus limicola DSM 2279 TaxID=937775 RepID=H1Z4C1_9EURY|nr:chemotaxis protein CheD [Methanoplanus limicola]EHQ36669.1 CheD [Methanoplanus limicola DSM 2279]